MYAALRSLDSLAVIRFLSRRISLDIPEGLFLGSELLLQAVLELTQDTLEVAVVLESASTLITLGLSHDFKWILNTIGERAVIERGRGAWRERVVGVSGKGRFNRFNCEGRSFKDSVGQWHGGVSLPGNWVLYYCRVERCGTGKMCG
jgi:hypothetical protein